MCPMFLLQVTDPSTYAQFGIAGALVMLIVVFLGFVLKALPTWKEVRLAEITVREKEADARAAQSTSFGKLSDVLDSIAVKQKEDINKVLLLQRVNADSSENIDEKFDIVIEHIDKLNSRMEAVEHQLVKGNIKEGK
jgi:hypothetical protein